MESSYSSKALARAIVIATVIAGTLEILSAFAFAIMAGGSPLGVLRGVGGAILDSEAVGPVTLAAGGLVLHFAIMTVMAAVYLVLAGRIALLNRLAVLSGVGYGLVLWSVMYWVVLPWRWPTMFPVIDPTEVAMQLFSHVVLVGIPIALVARSATRWRFTSDLM
ncbi:MAG: hypothetical protein WC729_10800 [Sphingomonas sp.]|uniref:hypothetical protein n=1 Tax=Sphingomonas sp. TaxID=28214 RepID=UPI0035688811